MLDTTINDSVNDDENPPPYYVGTVVDRNDPVNINRVRVTIPGKMEGPIDTLPWVAPFRLAPFGQGMGFGVYGVPPLGSRLLVHLQNDDTDYGFYAAGFFCVACANPNFNSPDLWGFQDPSGTMLVVNTATNMWTFTHVSGLTYSYDGNGNRITLVPRNSTETINGDSSLNVDGSLNEVVKGGWDMDVTGNVIIKTPNATIQAANTRVTGNLRVEGVITGLSGMNISGNNGSGSTMTMTGNLTHTDGYIMSNNVVLHTHEHPNGGGGAPTGSPTPGT